MKKIFVLLTLIFSIAACNQSTDNTEEVLKNRIDSLEVKISETYKPGFGEFMSSIQIHHNKLYFAGENKNWELANFEVQEIMESLEDISKYCNDREESKSIQMIQPAIDDIKNAISQKNNQLFTSSYIVLTNTCNNCHYATNHAFNVVKIPDLPPFSNQSFIPTK